MSIANYQLDVFEGPLDLLLYLVRKEEVDIYEVNLTKIATQFIAYVDTMKRMDLDVAGDFVVMAATLMYIKSKELLPVDKQAVSEDEGDQDDPRWELIRQLVEYKKFKDAASVLQKREVEQDSVYPRLPGKPNFEADPAMRRDELDVMILVNAVSNILKRFQGRSVTRDLFADRWTVSEKIEMVAGLLKERSSLKFSELFAAATSRIEVVVTFLALLELTRMKQIRVSQAETCGEIEITQAPPPASGSEAPAEPSPESSPLPN